METQWRNRITGLCCQNPEKLPFLGLWHAVKEGRHWPGSEQDLERPDSGSEPTETLCQSLRSLAAKIEPLWGKNWRQWEFLVPLDPTISSDLELRNYEKALIQALPHVETLSHNPRGHLAIEEIREDVGRARRVSHRAVASLAAHSEDWQTRTFLGVRPRRILAESRQDQWDIYENRAVATLRKRILGALQPRLQKLNQILQALDEASEHSTAILGTRFRTGRLYRLWGEAFASHPSRDRLAQLVKELEAARARLLALAETFLFSQMPHFSAAESPLHSTNIFQSDSHYRQVFHLWHKWESVASAKPLTPVERAARRRRGCEDWDLFVLLLVIRACRQLGLTPAENTAQPIALGERIRLVRNWTLLVQRDHSFSLECYGKPQLHIVGLYTSWRAQPEKYLETAFRTFLESEKPSLPVLIVSVDDSGTTQANWSNSLLEKFNRLRSSALFSHNLALVEVSPLKIDSTELLARIIRWVTAEKDWPRLPIQESVTGWSEVWPQLADQAGIDGVGQNIRFSRPPSESLIVQSQERASNAKQRMEQAVAARDKLKHEERRVRSNRRTLANVNLQKKELSELELQAKRRCEISTRIHECLKEVQNRFQVIQRCPCCQSTSVGKQKDTTIMTCLDCDSEWGRRTCPDCRRDYAFIVPHDAVAIAPQEKFDSVRMFGADMCAPLLPPTSAPFLAHSTECPWCKSVLP